MSIDMIIYLLVRAFFLKHLGSIIYLITKDNYLSYQAGSFPITILVSDNNNNYNKKSNTSFSESNHVNNTTADQAKLN